MAPPPLAAPPPIRRVGGGRCIDSLHSVFFPGSSSSSVNLLDIASSLIRHADVPRMGTRTKLSPLILIPIPISSCSGFGVLGFQGLGEKYTIACLARHTVPATPPCLPLPSKSHKCIGQPPKSLEPYTLSLLNLMYINVNCKIYTVMQSIAHRYNSTFIMIQNRYSHYSNC